MRFVSFLSAVAAAASASAQFNNLIPHFDIQAEIGKQVVKQLGVGAPIKLDVATAFGEVPGDSVMFTPPDHVMNVASPDDLKNPLKPGDYAVSVTAYCMMFGYHEPGAGMPYKLGRVQGKLATAVTTFLTQGTFTGVAAPDTNATVWRIEDGIALDEMPPADKDLIHKLAPECEKSLKGDILHQIRAPYDRFPLPGKPSFESILAKLGAPGKIAIQLYAARARLLDKAQQNRNLPQLLFQPLPDNLPLKLDPATGLPPSPWAEAVPGVFARLKVDAGVWGTNYVELHVTDQAGNASLADVFGLSGQGNSALVGYAVGNLDPQVMPTALLLVPLLGPPPLAR
jgi:hypothetical protein